MLREAFALRTVPVKPVDRFLLPSEKNADGGLGVKLQKLGKPVLSTDETVLVSCRPSHPHRPDQNYHARLKNHSVFWPVKREAWIQGRDQRFVLQSTWESFLEDTHMLSAVDSHVEEMRETHPETTLYMMAGHGKVDAPSKSDIPFIPVGLATLPWPHMHRQIRNIPDSHKDDRWVKYGEKGFRKLLEHQSDAGGELATQLCRDILASLGFINPVKVHNRLGKRGEFDAPRTVFGFPDFGSGVKAAHRLTQSVELNRVWKDVVSLVAHSDTDLPGQTSLRVAHRPCAWVIMPSADMKAWNGVTAEYPVWVSPFSLGSFSIFTPRGLTMQRSKPQ